MDHVGGSNDDNANKRIKLLVRVMMSGSPEQQRRPMKVVMIIIGSHQSRPDCLAQSYTNWKVIPVQDMILSVALKFRFRTRHELHEGFCSESGGSVLSLASTKPSVH